MTPRLVICRRAVSTSLMTWSWKLSPGLDVTRTLSQSDTTRVPPVTARAVAATLANHWGRLSGDGRLVNLGDALDDLAVRRDGIARLDEHDLARTQRMTGNCLVHPFQGWIVRQDERFRLDFATERAQAARASPPARFSHGLSETCHKDREPEPGGGLTRKGRLKGVSYQETANEENGGQDGSRLDHEHDRVEDQEARVEPAKCHLHGLPGE